MQNVSKLIVIAIVGIGLSLLSLKISWILASAVMACVVIYAVRFIMQSRPKGDPELIEATQHLISANINYQLSDAISELLKLRGYDAFNDKSCMNVFADLYNFSRDRELKGVVGELIECGCISQICNNRSQKDEAIVSAYNNLVSLNYSARTDKQLIIDVVATFLFAIAGVTRSDIVDYSIDNLNYTPNSTRRPAFERFRRKDIIQISLALFIMFGSTLLYLAYYHMVCWLFIIAWEYLIFQTAAMAWPIMSDESKKSHVPLVLKRRKYVTLLPVYIGFIINNIMGLFFLDSSFRDAVQEYIGFKGFIDEEDEPTFIAGTALVLLILWLNNILQARYRKIFSNKAQFKSAVRHSKFAIISVISIIVVGYTLILGAPEYDRWSNNQSKNNAIEKFCADIDTAIATNAKIRNERDSADVKLTFKGIQLGGNFSAIDSMYDSVKTTVNCFKLTYDCSDFSIVDTKDIKAQLYSHTQKELDTLHVTINKSEVLNAFKYWNALDMENGEYLPLNVKRVHDTFNDKPVDIDVYESGGKIAALRITDSEQYVYFDVPEYYILKDKYGEPERYLKEKIRYKEAKDFKVDDYYGEFNFYWTFKSGTVYFDISQIIYMSSDFMSHLDIMRGIYLDNLKNSDKTGR
jgi:hypothetical protein